MSVSICALFLFAPFLSPADAKSDLADARRTAFEAWANDDIPESARIAAGAIRSAASELAQLPRGSAASELTDEIELTLIRLEQMSSQARNLLGLQRLLDGIEISPDHGAAYARLAWIREGSVQALGLLCDWEFVGPFDNERGAGLKNPVDAESDPDPTATHAGKVREVSWRRLPEVAPRRGRIRFSQLIDPARQVCVVARTWVKTENDASVTLMLGMTEEARLWLGGEPIFEATGVHDYSKDAFAVPLELKAGWNEIALKLGGREGTPSFVARLVERESARPLKLETRAHAPEGVAPLVLNNSAVMMAELPPAPGIRTRLASDDSAEGIYHRALLERFFLPRPIAEHPGRALAVRAVEIAPDDLRFRVLRAQTLREAGSSAEQDVNPWLHAVDEVLALSPDLTIALRWKTHHAGWNQPTFDRALRLIDRALETNPDSLLALDTKRILLDYIGQGPLSDNLRKEIVTHEDASFFPSMRLSLASALPSTDPRRTQILEDAVLAGNSDALRARGRQRSFEIGAKAATLETLNRRLARTPWTVPGRLEAARALLTAGEPQEALRLIDEALLFAPERAVLHKWRARALLHMGDTERAIEALERELTVDYSASDERRLLEHLRSVGAAQFHVRYQEPFDRVLARNASHTDSVDERTSREQLLSRVIVDVNPDGTSKRYTRVVERILSEAGARDLDRITFRSGPGQEVRVLTADVHRADGTIEHARTGRSNRGGRTVDLPPLEIGDTVDFEWRLDDLRTTFFGNYFGFNQPFITNPLIPVHESEIMLIVPEEYPLAFHTRGGAGEPEISQAENGKTSYRWRMTDIQPRKVERLMPPPHEFLPSVQASSYASWDDFGEWWWNLIEEEIQVSPEMSDKVTALIEGLETPYEKLRAIYDFVVTDIRYNAWEFGVHGYQPYSAPVIFSRGFGDCKDKAILLRALLSEVAIESFPVLIRAEDRRFEEDHALALVEHFNHCIAYIPQQDGLPEMFLDGTARHHPIQVLPTMDNGAKVLVVTPDGVEQKRIPFARAERNRTEEDVHVSLNDEYGAKVRMTRKHTGRWDPAYRGRFDGSKEERQETANLLLAEVLGPLAGEVEVTFSDLDDLEVPVEMTFEAEAEQLARPKDDGYEVPASLHKARLLKTIASESRRETDLLLDVPHSQETRVIYELQPGSVPKEPPPPVSIETEDARYEWKATIGESSIEVNETFELKTHRVPVERYEAFRNLCRTVDETQQSFLEVAVKP